MALTKVTGQVIKNTTDVTVGVLTVTNTLAVGGTVSIGGTLTYEDVTNVDAVGLITARDGIKVGSGITLSVDGDGFFTGVITATSYSGIDLSDVTGATGDFSIADKIVHTGDTNTAIRFPADDTVTAETGGSERLRITSDGKIGINETSPGQRLTVGGDGYFGFATPTDAARQIIFNVNRGSAADTLANINWQWNSKNVAQIRGVAGADTTNKDDGHLAFYTSSANNLTERARITSDGKIGIGDDNPSYPLVLSYTDNTTYSSSNFIANGLQIENDSTTDNTASGIFFTAKGSGANAGAAHINCIRTANGSGTLTIATRHNAGNHAERFRITSDGKVCINNDTASSDLHVCTAGSSEEDGTLRLGGTSVGLGFLLEYDQSSATVATITSNPNYSNTSALLKICVDGASNANQLVLKGDGNIGINRSDPDRELCVNGVAEFNSYDNTGGGGSYYTAKGFMIGNAYDAGKASSVTDDRNSIVWNERGLDIDFATSDTLRMKVNYQGDIFFNGMTSLTASSTNKGVVMEESSNNGRINLHANSSAGNAAGILFYHSGSYQGGIYYSSSSVSYNTSSDYRLKENVTAISDGITRLKTLKPYRFNFKIDPSKTVDGFFAHEVTAVPEAVQGEKDAEDMQQLDYTKLTPLLTAALQEAVTKIETLEAEVAALKGS